VGVIWRLGNWGWSEFTALVAACLDDGAF
jgi:hypothetical protein